MSERRAYSRFVFQDIARFRTQLYDQLIAEHGLTTSQAGVLLTLYGRDAQIQSELAATMRIGTVTLGGLVDRLEARGLVTRKPVPGDRRANLVCLTDAARALEENLKNRAEEIDIISLSGIPESQEQAFRDMIHKVRDNLSTALAERRALNGK